MMKLTSLLPALAATLIVCGELRAAPNRISPDSRKVMDPVALAAKIDQLIEARCAEKGVEPAPLASDAEFLRRIYLDLTGRIPRVSEVREFLDDKSPNKRAKLIESLLDNPRHVMHLSNTWRAMMLPANNEQFQFLQSGFKNWLDRQVQNNVPYDRMVKELVAISVNNDANRFDNAASPLAFYQINEFKAENLAAATSRMFLGVRLECAQCHDHPFAKWTRKQFWEYAAFFSEIIPQQRKQPAPALKEKGREIAIPGTDKIVQARFLDGKDPTWQPNMDSRVTLADWLVSAENPYFARAAANRLWAQFFGLGINDPVDDEPTDENPSSHPDLLSELAQQFIANKFDVKYLVRAITLSKTYQRTSSVTNPKQNEPRLFARMGVRGMSPEQLFDSLALATGYQGQSPNPNQGFGDDFDGRGSPRAEFLQRFASQDKKTETQTSILQALAMMNGKFIADATSLDRSNTLGAVLDSPFLNNTQRIHTLFLATLSRPPRPAEAERMLNYVNSGGTRNDPRAALADVFWVLLNSSEFMFNH